MQKIPDDMLTLFKVAKGIENPKTDRLKIYRELVFNRFEDFIKATFPNFSSYAGENLRQLIKEFVKTEHRSPLLLDVGKEFVKFFKNFKSFPKEEKPFLEDLLLYEWLEVEVFNSPDEETSYEFSWNEKYRLSVFSRLQEFEYPVHKLKDLRKEEIVKRKGKYYLLIYRDSEDKVRHVELTPFVYNFLSLINSGVEPLRVFDKLEVELDRSIVKEYLEKFLMELIQTGILVKR